MQSEPCFRWPNYESLLSSRRNQPTPANAKDLIAVADAAQVLTPGGLLGVANQIRPRNMVMMAELAATQAGKVGFRAIRAGTVDTEALLMVDPLHRKASVQRVPGGAFIGMHRGAF